MTHELQLYLMLLVAAAHTFERVLAMVHFHMCGSPLGSEAVDACRKGMALRRLGQRLPEGAALRMCSRSSTSSRGTLLLREPAGRPQRRGRSSLQMRPQQL